MADSKISSLADIGANLTVSSLLALVDTTVAEALVTKKVTAGDFISVFSIVTSDDHNALSSLQGGISGEKYHLTSAQNTIATQEATEVLAGYISAGSQTIGGTKVFAGDIAIQGALATTDNLIVLNDGEVGAGVTLGTSGLEIDRGSSPNYQILFRESDDAFVIGEPGALQVVATREDTPLVDGVAVWNNIDQRFDTRADRVGISGTNILIGGYGPSVTGAGNFIVGDGAAANTISISSSIVIGKDALGTGVCTGTENIVIGLEAGKNLTSGHSNTIIGVRAGEVMNTGLGNVFLGEAAGGSVTNGQNNVFVGLEAGMTTINRTGMTALGYRAGGSCIGGHFNVYIGYYAGRTSGSSTSSVYIGESAGILATGNDNCIIGSKAADVATTMSGSVILGTDALGAGVCTSADNTIIGTGAGNSLISGGSNVLLGHDAGAQLTTQANRLVIANSNTITPLLGGEFDNKNLGINSMDFADGVGVMAIADATTAPTTNPTGGLILLSDGGVLKVMEPTGTLKTVTVS